MASKSRSDFSACEIWPSGVRAGGGSDPSSCFTAKLDLSALGRMFGDDVVDVLADEVARWWLITNFARSLACAWPVLRVRSSWKKE